jgi:hypothetical protein
LEHVPADVQLLWLVLLDSEHVPQVLWLAEPDSEHVPADVQLLWLV